LSTIYGKRIVFCKISKWETVRELGLAGQNEKGTPTMGGLIIISLPGACCVVCKVAKYLRSALIVTTLWMGTIGFIDDYIKIFKKRSKD
jgi:phospho-N-acetylmuramoyl-pentapeptide-transferase